MTDDNDIFCTAMESGSRLRCARPAKFTSGEHVLCGIHARKWRRFSREVTPIERTRPGDAERPLDR